MKRRMTTIVCRLFCVTLVLTSLAWRPATAQTNTALPADKIAKIETAVSSLMSRQNIPAVSVAIVEDNQIRFQRGYGMADVENFVPAKALTVYRIASVSKSLTAVAAMQLAEKGKLDLDAPVQKYVPSFPAKNFPVTARQLLAHLSGIRNYRPGEGGRTNRYDTLTEALGIFKDDPLDFEPGTRYGYGWYVGRSGGFSSDPDSVWHGGVQPGFTSELWILPKKRFALVILTNLEGGGRLGLGTLTDQISDIVLR